MAEDDARQTPFHTLSEPKTIMITAQPTEPKDVKAVGTRFLEDCCETDAPGPRSRQSRLSKERDIGGMTGVKAEKKPLRLLDLPVDILKDIVREACRHCAHGKATRFADSKFCR